MGRNPRIVYGRGTRPGTARAARRARAGSTASRTGVAPARRSAPRRRARSSRRRCRAPASATCSRAWRWPAASAPPCSSASGPATACIVDVSLMSAGLWAMGMTISGTSVLDVDELPHQGHFASPNPLTNQYRTKDGHFIALGFLQADKYWPEFCMAVDRLEWIGDERFTTMEDRRVNAEACVALLDELFAERTLAEWEERALAPAGPVGRVPQGRPGALRRAGAGQRVRPARRARRRRQGRARAGAGAVRRRGHPARPGAGARRRHRRRAGRPRVRRRRRSPTCEHGASSAELEDRSARRWTAR